MDELRCLDRQAALGRSRLASLQLPSHEAMMVQMVATDLQTCVESLQCISERLAFRRRAGSKFDLVLYLAARDRIATYRTGRAGAWAGEDATRSRHRQAAALDCSAGLLSEDCVIGHRSSSSNRFARPRTARGAAQRESDGRRANTTLILGASQ